MSLLEIAGDLLSPVGKAQPELILKAYKEDWTAEEFMQVSRLAQHIEHSKQKRQMREIKRENLN